MRIILNKGQLVDIYKYICYSGSVAHVGVGVIEAEYW